MVDAVTGVRHACRPFEVEVDGPAGTSVEAAAAGAAHRVLTELYPARTRQFDALLDRSLAALGEGDGVDKGLALGRYVAKEVLVWRAEDGSDREVRFTPKHGPGEWQPTPPTFAKPLCPQWPTMTCFALRRGYQFRADGPPKLTDKAYTKAFDEVKSLGAKDSKARTAEQTEIALFWADGAGTVTPPGHWNQIAQAVSRDRRLTLEENARLFALLNVATGRRGHRLLGLQVPLPLLAADPGASARQTRTATRTRPRTATGSRCSPPRRSPSYTSRAQQLQRGGGHDPRERLRHGAGRFETTSDGLPGVTRRFTSFWARPRRRG